MIVTEGTGSVSYEFGRSWPEFIQNTEQAADSQCAPEYKAAAENHDAIARRNFFRIRNGKM